MPFIDQAQAPTFALHGATFTGLAAPSRGAAETAVWIVTLAPGTPGTPHRLTREEILVALEGRAVAQLGEMSFELAPGSALIIPPDTDFCISNLGQAQFRAVAVLPVGGQAQLKDGVAFTPPWAA